MEDFDTYAAKILTDTFLSQQQKAFRAEVRAFFRDACDDTVYCEIRELASEHSPTFYRRLLEAKYLGVNWPQSAGGRGLSGIEAVILLEEAAIVGAPMTMAMLTWLVGSTIMDAGNEQLTARFLPQALRGDCSFCLGYTEPEAGSDLAALRTRAVRDGDAYVVNGEKVFSSLANVATHALVAVRTDPGSEGHAGISLLVTPLNSAGIEIFPIHTMADFRTNRILFRDVRVDVGYRVGVENKGWQVLTSALDLERTGISRIGLVLRVLRQIDQWANSSRMSGAAIGRDELDRRQRLYLHELQACRLLAYSAIGSANSTAAASMAKLASTELAQQVLEFAMTAFPDAVVLSDHEVSGEVDVQLEYRNSVRFTITGGASEIQRNIIARSSLKLPVRSRSQ